MTHHEFDILTQKFLAGQCSAEELEVLAKWSDMHMQHSNDHLAFENEAEADKLGQRIWESISTEAEVATPVIGLNLKWVWSGVAACLALISFYIVSNHFKPQWSGLDEVGGIETRNTAPSRQKVVLPDGSIVVLEKDAKIITDLNYGKGTRTVYLTGEAFFDIRRDPKTPFLVHSGELVTEVLGTSFRIKPGDQNRTIEVAVKTGRVSVYANNGNQTKKFSGAIITPNQRVFYDVDQKTIREDLVDAPEIIASDINAADLRLDEVAVQNVVPLIQKAYGLDIVIANPVLGSCFFTGDLNGLTMYQQLDFICGVINARYEIRGTTIFITGKGCN